MYKHHISLEPGSSREVSQGNKSKNRNLLSPPKPTSPYYPASLSTSLPNLADRFQPIDSTSTFPANSNGNLDIYQKSQYSLVVSLFTSNTSAASVTSVTTTTAASASVATGPVTKTINTTGAGTSAPIVPGVNTISTTSASVSAANVTCANTTTTTATTTAVTGHKNGHVSQRKKNTDINHKDNDVTLPLSIPLAANLTTTYYSNNENLSIKEDSPTPIDNDAGVLIDNLEQISHSVHTISDDEIMKMPNKVWFLQSTNGTDEEY